MDGNKSAERKEYEPTVFHSLS